MPALPEGTEEQAHLPRIIRALVQRRRTVKDLIKSERDPVGGCGACVDCALCCVVCRSAHVQQISLFQVSYGIFAAGGALVAKSIFSLK